MRYICPLCGMSGSNVINEPDRQSRPICHICDYAIEMIPFNVNEHSNLSELKKGTIYINNKNRDEYLIIGCAINCTNEIDGQFTVIYKLNNSCSLLFVREREEFFRKFTKKKSE